MKEIAIIIITIAGAILAQIQRNKITSKNRVINNSETKS